MGRFIPNAAACDKCWDLEGEDLTELPHPNCQCSIEGMPNAVPAASATVAAPTRRPAAKRPKRSRRTQSGCRPGQLMGGWLIKPTSLGEMLAYAKAHPIPAASGGRARISRRRPEQPDASEEAFDEDEEVESYAAVTTPDYPVENGIARLTISGPMTKYPNSYQEVFGGTSTVMLRAAIRDIASRDDIAAALIEISSPGGTVAGTQPLAEDLYRLARVKPVHIHASDDMDSAALWVGSQGNFISADPMTWIGSIGAKVSLFDTSGMYAAEGIVAHVITNTGGTYKAIGADGAPIPPEHVDEVRRELDAVHELFVAGIARGRQVSIEQIRPIADGRVFIAAEAIGLGLIDRVASIDEAMSYLRQQVSSTGPVRGRLGRMNNTADDRKEPLMPLTPQQIQRARTISALAQTPEAEVPDKLIELAGRSPTLEQTVAARDATIGTLTTERNTAREALTAAQASVPKPADPALVEARRELFAAKVETLAASGKVNTATKTKLMGMVGAEAGKGVERNVIAGADGKCVMDGVLELYADATPARKTGETTAAQPRIESAKVLTDAHGQGEKTEADEGKAQGEAYAAEQIKRMEAARAPR